MIKNNIELIKNAYENENRSIADIAKNIVHKRTSYVNQIIKENGFQRRTKPIFIPGGLTLEQEKEVCQLYSTQQYTQKFLSEKFNCSSYIIHKILEKNNINIYTHPKHKKDCELKENYFEVIDTPNKAYILGFIFADGNVYKNQLSIEIHVRDIELLYFIKRELNTINKISYRKRENTELVCLRVVSEKICSDLGKYGVVPNKTYLTKHLPNIEEELLPHFLRGLVDGDGWISKTPQGYYKIGFVTHFESVAQDFKSYCETLINKTSQSKITKKNKSGNCFVCQFQDKDTTKRLATALYKDAACCLTRKYLLAEQIFKSLNDDEDIV